ncbi:ribbon-helix-helix domain-containing protein [Candidatus Woesearchaeota archaeon]|nr:ribbon-helix-helix domain-containing protein [Candidatus Woesearchaeota archaeon]
MNQRKTKYLIVSKKKYYENKFLILHKTTVHTVYLNNNFFQILMVEVLEQETKNINTESYLFVLMGMQISLKLSDKMFNTAKNFSEEKGYDTLQDFIRETIREKLFEQNNEKLRGIQTYKASEKTLAKRWSTAKEAKAWSHLQKKK